MTEIWEAFSSERTTATWVEDADGKRVCTMQQHESEWDRARLIAAAPELLEGLQGVMQMLNDLDALHEAGEDDNKAIAKCRAAIDKAQGK